MYVYMYIYIYIYILQYIYIYIYIYTYVYRHTYTCAYTCISGHLLARWEVPWWEENRPRKSDFMSLHYNIIYFTIL